jgi:hypothetical protein
MKRNIETVLALLLIVGNVLTHLWGWMPGKWQNAKFDYFLKPGFHYEMSFAWWLHDLMDCLNKVIVLFVTAMIATEISRTLFRVVFVFLLYEVADFWLLLWDYKQTKEIYWVMSAALIVSLLIVLRKHGMKMVK